MQLTNLFASEEDRAVSPVIGVILMVAITVILAAVIGAFVLGLGGDQEEAPQASLNLDCDSGTEAELNHRGGDDIDEDEVSATEGSIETFGTLSTGESADVDGLGSDDRFVLVHDPSDSILIDRSC